MKKLDTLFLITFLALIGGCVSASGPYFTELVEPQEGKTVIYIYRQYDRGYPHTNSAPNYTINGKDKYKLINGSYIRHEVAPGKYTIETTGEFDTLMFATWPVRKVTIQADEGQVYYVEYSVSEGSGPPGSASNVRSIHTNFYHLFSEEALPLLKRTRAIK